MAINIKPVVTNRRAFRNFHIIEKFEAGLVLTGDEVKSLRQGKANLSEGFARVDNKEAIIYNLHISPYKFASDRKIDPLRPRKLLLKRRELNYLELVTRQKGVTIVPLSIYFKGGYAKAEIALAKGKKLFDKREDLKRKEAQLEVESALRRSKKKGI